MDYQIDIDQGSGFCFGVVNAIKKAEDMLKDEKPLYCLGDIVHNGMEVARLEKLGLITIGYEEFESLKDASVLLRAHGEPPSTYQTAKKNNVRLIDATCPVVLHLQRKVHVGYDKTKKKEGLVIIYGKKGHAEVNGLVGQTNDEAIVIEDVKDLDHVNFNQNIYLYSQTTKQEEGLALIEEEIRKRLGENGHLELHNSICKQVSQRIPGIKKFAAERDLILFVSGMKSSNGRMLYNAAHEANSNAYFITNAEMLDLSWIKDARHIGICGATSTPRWLMEEVESKVKHYLDAQ